MSRQRQTAKRCGQFNMRRILSLVETKVSSNNLVQCCPYWMSNVTYRDIMSCTTLPIWQRRSHCRNKEEEKHQPQTVFCCQRFTWWCPTHRVKQCHQILLSRFVMTTVVRFNVMPVCALQLVYDLAIQSQSKSDQTWRKLYLAHIGGASPTESTFRLFVLLNEGWKSQMCWMSFKSGNNVESRGRGTAQRNTKLHMLLVMILVFSRDSSQHWLDFWSTFVENRWGEDCGGNNTHCEPMGITNVFQQMDAFPQEVQEITDDCAMSF